MTPAKIRLFTLKFALSRIHIARMNHGSPCLRSPCAVTKPLKWAPSLIHKTLQSLWVKLRETLLSRPLRVMHRVVCCWAKPFGTPKRMKTERSLFRWDNGHLLAFLFDLSTFDSFFLLLTTTSTLPGAMFFFPEYNASFLVNSRLLFGVNTGMSLPSLMRIRNELRIIRLQTNV